MDNEPRDDLRERRKATGLTPTAFAREAGLDRGTVGRIETGEGGVARPESIAIYENVLARIEAEQGKVAPLHVDSVTSAASVESGEISEPGGADGPDAIHIEVYGNFGIRISARGSVRYVQEVRDAVAHLVRTMNGEEDQGGQSGQPQSA